MIGYIRGKVTALFKDSCFLEAGGIGYRIFISDKTRQQLASGEEAKLLTYMAVREDAILLYGFLGKEEYDLFLLLISISKVGPKVAMGILSAMTPSAFVGATGSVTQLTKLPGIGKKTAERLLVELKDKVGAFSVETVSDEGSGPAPSAEGDPVIGEAVKALMSLGYEMDEITPVLGRLSGSYDNVSKLVSAALREFAKNRE